MFADLHFHYTEKKVSGLWSGPAIPPMAEAAHSSDASRQPGKRFYPECSLAWLKLHLCQYLHRYWRCLWEYATYLLLPLIAARTCDYQTREVFVGLFRVRFYRRFAANNLPTACAAFLYLTSDWSFIEMNHKAMVWTARTAAGAWCHPLGDFILVTTRLRWRWFSWLRYVAHLQEFSCSHCEFVCTNPKYMYKHRRDAHGDRLNRIGERQKVSFPSSLLLWVHHSRNHGRMFCYLYFDSTRPIWSVFCFHLTRLCLCCVSAHRWRVTSHWVRPAPANGARPSCRTASLPCGTTWPNSTALRRCDISSHSTSALRTVGGAAGSLLCVSWPWYDSVEGRWCIWHSAVACSWAGLGTTL